MSMTGKVTLQTALSPGKPIAAAAPATHQGSTSAMPSYEQWSVFARRVRRIIRDEKGRTFLGVAVSEADFSLYPDVVRVLAWMEQQGEAEGQTSRPVNLTLAATNE